MNKPIRILHVFAGMDRGGAETMVMNLYRHIDRTQIQFDFMVHTNKHCSYDNEIENLGGKIFRVPKYKAINHYHYIREWEKFFINHSSYYIVHGHIRSTASIYLRIANKRNIMTISHSHSTASRGNIISRIIKKIMQYPIRHIADHLFACSYESGIWLYGSKAVNKNNFRIIKNAIDLDLFAFNQKRRNQIRDSMQINNKFVIGHIGSMTKPKNHIFLIEILKEIKSNSTFGSNVVLLLVGDGYLKDSLIEKVALLGLEDMVIFTGIRTDIHNILNAIDILVFPSIYEGLPVTLIEAQANGIKCIVSDTITLEVKVSEELEYVSLSETKQYWAKKITDNFYGLERKDNLSLIRKEGYDISDNSKIIEKLYLESTV